MRSGFFLVPFLLSVVRARKVGEIEDVAALLDDFPDVKSALGSEVSQWSTATAEASSFLCSLWKGETPAQIAAALTLAPNSDLSSEWMALSTDISSIAKKSDVQQIGTACSTYLAAVATTSPGNAETGAGGPVTVTATVTVTAAPVESSCGPLSTGSSASCADTCCAYYKVKSGDTCDSIASHHHIAEAKIEQWNPKSCGQNLQIGVELCISGPAKGRAPPYGSFPIPSNNTAVASGVSGGTAPASTSTSTSCPPNTCCKHYKVRSGDSCDSIATKKHIPEEKIEEWNPGKCGENLQIGVELCISSGSSNSTNTTSAPPASTSASTCQPNTCCKYYKVNSGDSCDGISTKMNVPETSIVEWNPGQCGVDLQIGAHLCIDGPATGAAPPFGTCSSSSCCHYSKVKSGDSCFSIATARGIAESFLEDWNPSMCGSGLRVGAELCVVGPAAQVGFGVSSSTTAATSLVASATSTPVSAATAAAVSTSPGRRVSTGIVQGLFAILLAVGLFP